MHTIKKSYMLLSISFLILIMPLSLAGSSSELSNDDGDPELYAFYYDFVGSEGDCAQYFHSDVPLTVLSAKVAFTASEDFGERSYVLRFFEAVPDGDSGFVPGGQFGPEVPFSIASVPVAPEWAWYTVSLPATRIFATDFYVAVGDDDIGDDEYGLLFDVFVSDPQRPWSVMAKTDSLTTWTSVNELRYGAESSTSVAMYLRLELNCLPSIVASMKPLVSTALLDAQAYWECISEHLPADVDARAETLICEIGTCMSNASSLSNPIYASGELTRAVGHMAELDRALRLNCRILSCGPECDGSVMLLSVNDTLYLDLPENPSTGYAWALEAGEGILILGDEYVHGDLSGMMIGSGGTHSWELKAKMPGIYTIVATYARPWDAEDVASTFEMTVKVD
jgi:predicted secreted protein